MQPKQLFLLITLFVFAHTVKAQEYQPFKEIGKKVKVLTLSNGKYDEFFDYKDVQRIGSIMFNIRTKKIVKLLNADSIFKKFSDNSSASRWYSVDPLAEKLSSYSPYNYALNNPVNMVDPDGQFPYPIHVRSFAPYKSFGLGFEGDSRVYSTGAGKRFEGGSVTSRIQQSFIVDPTAGSISSPRTWSDQSSHPLFGTKTGTPNGDITDFKSTKDNNGNSTASFTSNYAGNLPLIPSSDIDVHTKFSLIENTKAGTLMVTATQTGDQYPAAETFIGDTKGNQLFIGVSPAVGFDDRQSFGPFQKLPGDNKLPMMTNTFTITLDSKGVFTGVRQGDKSYTTSDWNKMMQAKPLEQQQEKPLPVR